MDNNTNIRRIIVVYLLLIPVMWFLIEGVWGGLHGAMAGLKIGMVLRDPQKSADIRKFLEEHGITEATSRKEAGAWLETLSQKDREQFQSIILKSIKEKYLVSFGSALAVCIIVFGFIGLTSGVLTKTWLFAGFFPAISFLLNNPVIRFRAILHIPPDQRVAIVLLGQFLACYVFAFAGAFTCKAMKKRKRRGEASLNNAMQTDSE